jgi:hypothetical protein
LGKIYARFPPFGQLQQGRDADYGKIIVSVQGETERADVTLHWVGGFTSQHELVRPVARYEQLSHCDQLLTRLATLRDAGQTTTQIAHQLNQEGWHPPKRRATVNGPMVRQLLSRKGLVRLPSLTVLGCRTLPTSRAGRLPLADPSGTCFARCPSRHQTGTNALRLPSIPQLQENLRETLWKDVLQQMEKHPRQRKIARKINEVFNTCI